MEMEVRLEKLPQVFEPESLSLSSTPQESVVDMTHSPASVNKQDYNSSEPKITSKLSL
jgi:hypothetical protein